MKGLALVALALLLVVPVVAAQNGNMDGNLQSQSIVWHTEFPQTPLPAGTEFFVTGWARHVQGYAGGLGALTTAGCTVISDTIQTSNENAQMFATRLRIDGDACVWYRAVVFANPALPTGPGHTEQFSGAVAAHQSMEYSVSQDFSMADGEFPIGMWVPLLFGFGLLLWFLTRDAILPALVMSLYILTLFVPDVGYNLVVSCLWLLLAVWIHAHARGILPRFMRGAPPKA